MRHHRLQRPLWRSREKLPIKCRRRKIGFLTDTAVSATHSATALAFHPPRHLLLEDSLTLNDIENVSVRQQVFGCERKPRRFG
jgi:hypothetical protein